MKKRRQVSPDERALWDSVARQAEPLDPKRMMEQVELGEVQGPATAEHSVSIIPFSLGEKSNAAPVALAKGNSLRMDASAFAKLKRGKLKPERKIDLHGMTVSQAHPALIRFLLDAHSERRRLVLVITGKGDRAEPTGPFQVQRGVLRRQVPVWLTTPPLNGIILQFTPAHQRHGGDGALYIYLRRQR